MFTMVQNYINPFGYGYEYTYANPFCSCNSGMDFFVGLITELTSRMYFNNISYSTPALNYPSPAVYPYYTNPSVFTYQANTGSNPFAYQKTGNTSYSPNTNTTLAMPTIPSFGGGSYSKTASNPSSSSSTAATSTQPYSSNALSGIKNSSLMKNVPQDRKERILAAVEKACQQYNVDPKLVIAMMSAESGFDPNATSHCGAAGLMQLMPGTARTYGATDVYNIEQNINAAVKFIKYLKDRYNGNMDLMVAAYNAGPGRVKTSIPAIRETQNYVAKVKRNYASLA